MKSRITNVLVGAGLALSGSALAVPLVAAPASALPLPAACPSYGPCADVTVTLNKSTDPPGGTITITIQEPNGTKTFTVTLHSSPTTLGTMTTDSSGYATGTFTIPNGEPPGQHSIVVSDPQGDTGSATLTITPGNAANTPAATHLPFTGTDSAALAGIGAAAIGGGGILVLGSRRRRGRAWRASR